MPLLTPLLRSAYTLLTGASLDSFSFAEAPLSNDATVYASGVVYLLLIFSTRYIMQHLSSLSLRSLFYLHNMFLSVVSAVLFFLLADQVASMWSRHGLFWSICNAGALTKEIEVIYYLNYLTKYYELIDTVFLVLKKKKLEFLHWYHHSLTMILCFIQLQGRPSVQWVPILLNLMVHVVMYAYYAQTSLGHRPWFKKYITTLQITQFIVDLVAIYFATYNYYAFNYQSTWPCYGSCTGTELSAVFGCALLTSYLGLFVQFFGNTYSKKSTAIAMDRKQEKKLTVNKKKFE